MKHHTHASCFSVFALPHLLFIPKFEERRKVLQSCCLAWNISLFPDHQQRAQQIDMVWKLIETDNPDAPPPGLEEGFKGELHMLAEKKIDLFPWLIASIPRADLEQNGLHDRLHVETDNGVEDINLVIHPDPLGLPVIIDVLRGIQRDTTEQVQLLQRLNRIPNGIDDALVKQAIKSYSVQRADLIGYHRILTVWRQSQPAPSVQRVINHWLGVLMKSNSIPKRYLVSLKITTTMPVQ